MGRQKPGHALAWETGVAEVAVVAGAAESWRPQGQDAAPLPRGEALVLLIPRGSTRDRCVLNRPAHCVRAGEGAGLQPSASAPPPLHHLQEQP